MWVASMTTWTIRTETDNLERVDGEPFKKSGRSLYQIVMGVIIWGTAIAATLGGLYACSVLSGDPLAI